MGEALRWLLFGYLAYAAGILPWALLALGFALRRHRRGGLTSPSAHAGAGAVPVYPKLPQPPLMDPSTEPFDPAPPAWRGTFKDGPSEGQSTGADCPPAGFPWSAESDNTARPSPGHWDRRLALAEARDLARTALLGLADAGYYAFEDLLVSGVGAIDQLVVGPAGLRVLVVAPERGHVWREEGGEITFSTDARVDLEAGRVEGTFENPEEDLDAVATALAQDVATKLGGIEAEVWPVVVFPHAEVYSGPGGAHGIVSVWSLAEALDYPEHRCLSAEAAEDIASLIAGAYGREPWMRPTSDHEPCPDA